jgi:hypothetical protein
MQFQEHACVLRFMCGPPCPLDHTCSARLRRSDGDLHEATAIFAGRDRTKAAPTVWRLEIGEVQLDGTCRICDAFARNAQEVRRVLRAADASPTLCSQWIQRVLDEMLLLAGPTCGGRSLMIESCHLRCKQLTRQNA